MRKIVPYKTTRNALAALDNGGRFYNFMSKANDGDISSAELAKVAGVFQGTQKMILFFEMALMHLEVQEKQKIIDALDQDVRLSYNRYTPKQFVPSTAKKEGVASQSAIVTGVPKLMESKADFTGFIMVPIMTGNTMTFAMIPIIDQYDIYELRDEETSDDFIIGHARGKFKLPQRMVRCGGILKEFKSKKQENSDGNIFLETVYYTPLS